jgi:hypothetical protein
VRTTSGAMRGIETMGRPYEQREQALANFQQSFRHEHEDGAKSVMFFECVDV